MYQSHLVQRLCMGLQHRIPDEWILLESLDTGEIHECRSQGEKQQPLSESGGRWVKGGADPRTLPPELYQCSLLLLFYFFGDYRIRPLIGSDPLSDLTPYRI